MVEYFSYGIVFKMSSVTNTSEEGDAFFMDEVTQNAV